MSKKLKAFHDDDLDNFHDTPLVSHGTHKAKLLDFAAGHCMVP